MPNMDELAGNGTFGSVDPFQLFAGETAMPTTYEIIASAVAVIAQYTVLGRRADGKMVPWAPNTSDESGKTFATGTLTFGGQPTATTDTITINGHAITYIANGVTPVGAQIALGTTATLTAVATAAYINANVDTLAVNAASAGTVVSLTAETSGAAGNAIGIAKSGTYPSVSAATLTGGADTAGAPAKESHAIAVLAQPMDTTAGDQSGPVFLGGVFNHENLVWPAGVTTELARKAAFDGTMISVKSLK